MRGLVVVMAVSLIGAGCFTEEPGGTSGDNVDTATDSGCQSGAVGCTCVAGECLGSAYCDSNSNLCFPETCDAGSFECPCRDGATCDPALSCVEGVCVLEPVNTGGATAGDATSAATTSADADTNTGGDIDTTASEPGTGPVFLYYGWETAADFAVQAGSGDPADVREYLDMQCNDVGTRPPPALCAETAAVISLTKLDTVRALADRLPTGPLRSPNRSQVAPSFPSALAGAGAVLTESLKESGVYPMRETTNQWWSFSDEHGEFHSALSCGAWGPGNRGQGQGGLGTVTSTDWIASSSPPPCNTERWILCACWNM